MTQKFKNNTFGLLANTITGAATNITLATGHGARFPTLAAGEYFKATLVQINISTLAETAWEIVKITARSGDVLTVERAQEGTLALAWEANTRIEMRVTAETLVMLSNAGASAAISAQASATAAAGSANTASTKAGEAATSATNAATSATTATTKAGEAATSASNAATSASNAAGSATTATTKAGEASTSATNAAGSANTASTKAGEAATSAAVAAAPPAVGLGTGSAINCALGEVFYKTITANTTFSRTNVKPSGQVTNIILELTNGGNYTISWWSGIKWQQGAAPALTSGGTDILGFYSYDGGTTWRGVLLSRDSK